MLLGFATISLVIAVGWLLAHLRVVDLQAQRVLSLVAFYVCSPALLLTVLQRTPLSQVLSRNLVGSATAVVLTMALAVLVARVRSPGRRLGDRLIGALCAAYVNAGNLGIPIALYVLGDVAWVAPTLLLQLLVITPLVMVLFDRDAAARPPSLLRGIASLGTNPISLGALLGLILAVAHVTLPAVVADPVRMLGDMAVPAMLMAFGISLRLGPKPAAGGSLGDVAWLVGLKTVGMPVVAALAGMLALGMRGRELFALVVTAALPTAQNIFTYAVRYDRSIPLARDVIFFSTFASLPVILLIAAGFHALGAA